MSNILLNRRTVLMTGLPALYPVLARASVLRRHHCPR